MTFPPPPPNTSNSVRIQWSYAPVIAAMILSRRAAQAPKPSKGRKKIEIKKIANKSSQQVVLTHLYVFHGRLIHQYAMGMCRHGRVFQRFRLHCLAGHFLEAKSGAVQEGERALHSVRGPGRHHRLLPRPQDLLLRTPEHRGCHRPLPAWEQHLAAGHPAAGGTR